MGTAVGTIGDALCPEAVEVVAEVAEVVEVVAKVVEVVLKVVGGCGEGGWRLCRKVVDMEVFTSRDLELGRHTAGLRMWRCRGMELGNSGGVLRV